MILGLDGVCCLCLTAHLLLPCAPAMPLTNAPAAAPPPAPRQDTIFAVKAPKGTTLEMPDPVDGPHPHPAGGQRHYRIVLRSKRDSVEVFLVQHAKSGIGQQAAAAAAPAGAAAAAPAYGLPGAAPAPVAAAFAEQVQVQAAAEAAAAQALQAAEDAVAAATGGPPAGASQQQHHHHNQQQQQAVAAAVAIQQQIQHQQRQQQFHLQQQHQHHLNQQQQPRPRALPPPPLFPPEQGAGGANGPASAQPSPITALLARAMAGGASPLIKEEGAAGASCYGPALRFVCWAAVCLGCSLLHAPWADPQTHPRQHPNPIPCRRPRPLPHPHLCPGPQLPPLWHRQPDRRPGAVPQRAGLRAGRRQVAPGHWWVTGKGCVW